MKDDIESYEEPEFEVLEKISNERWIVRLPERVRVDRAVRFQTSGGHLYGRAVRQLGNERVEVQTFGGQDLAAAEGAEVLDEPPSLPLPWDVGPIEASDLELGAPGEGPQWPPRSLAMSELSGARTQIEVGIGPVDLIAPIAGGGFNLVIDASRDRAAFDFLVGRLGRAVDIDVRVDDEEPPYDVRRRLHAAGDVSDYEQIMAAALAWIADERHRRDTIVAVMELPLTVADYDATSPGTPGAASQIADAVSSTRDCEVTCLLRLPAATGPEGFSDIVETLSLGEVDAQIFVDSQGRFEPSRSHSSAPVTDETQRERASALSTLHRAERARERHSLWGDDDLEPEELEALELAEGLRVELTES